MKTKTLPRLALYALLAFSLPCAAATYRVVGVSDGDTVTVLSEARQEVKCRLYGIDAPESRQAFGQVSKRALSDAIYGKHVQITVTDRDRYGRSICKIFLDGAEVNVAMVRAGYAWVYRRYTKDQRYYAAESAAREERAGLWRDSNPVPPWDFRRKR